MKRRLACLGGLLGAALSLGYPATLKAEPLSPPRDAPLRLTPADSSAWRVTTGPRPAVELDNVTITFDVGASKLVVLWGVKL